MKINRRILQGEVTSTKDSKTIVVNVERQKKHPVYHKNYRVHKKFKAHDKNGKASEGDFVKIIESKPYSKDKKYNLLEIVERSNKE